MPVPSLGMSAQTETESSMTLAAAKAATAKQRNRSLFPVVMGVEDFRIMGTNRYLADLAAKPHRRQSLRVPGNRSRRVVILTRAFVPGCLDKTD